MTSIRAFSHTSLQEVAIPASVRCVDEGAFSCCFQLASVRFSAEAQLGVIMDHAFYRTKLHEVAIPASVKEIDQSPFAGTQVRIVSIRSLQKCR